MLYLLLLLPLLPALYALRERTPARLASLSLGAAWFSLALGLLAQNQASGPLRLDGVGLFYLLLTDFIFGLVALYARAYFQESQDQEAWRFFAAGNLFLFAMHGAFLAHNLGLLWIFVEGSTLASALLVYHKGGARALEATWKYLMLGSVGIALGLIGVILVYALLGGTTLDWQEAREWARTASAAQLGLAFAFLLVGFGTKVGLFPLHAWLPDAHSEAPSPASALLSGTLLNVAFYALLRYTALLGSAGLFEKAALLLQSFGLISLLAAGLFLFAQKDFKRLLAYSSMEHMGLAVYALGLGLPWLAMLHTLFHSLLKTAAFLGAGNLLLAYRSKLIARVGGVYQAWPAGAWVFLLALLGLAGLPPFGLFFAEFQALLASAPWAMGLYLLGLVSAFAGLLWPLSQMIYGPGTLPHRPQGQSLVLVPGVLLAVGLFLGLLPPVELVKTWAEVLAWTR
ncbi:proton-conducting transporter membrane subunit [Meiothermus rufus]|uniref:proton-conducting transporter transmembrane domain-containing protein n=1 Tax=Meiothermus rufus TaxID=604332 RepID=UPI00042463D3|nr:proton-conducting transporter membrane subunit [Meiothermus rufus]